MERVLFIEGFFECFLAHLSYFIVSFLLKRFHELYFFSLGTINAVNFFLLPFLQVRFPVYILFLSKSHD